MWSRIHQTRCWRVRHLEGCKAVVWKTITQAGRVLLVDLKEDPAGNTSVWQDAPGALRSRAITEDCPRAGLEKVMMPHPATCPVVKRLREGDTRTAAPGIDKVKAALPDNVIPFRARAPR